MPIPAAAAPYLAEFAVNAGTAAVNAVTKGGPRRQYKFNKRAAEDSNRMARENAEWQLEQNKRLQAEQRIYDSPAAQMQRYKEAGLNPHLIYGSGSSSGSAFPIQAPGIAPSRYDAPGPFDLNFQAPSFLGAQMSMETMALQRQKVLESQSKSALADAQKDIAKTNPMLNPYVYQATIFQLEAVADQKAQEARYLSDFIPGTTTTRTEARIDKGLEAVQTSINKLNTELGIKAAMTEKDVEIKNKILESKEFENALKKIQKEWLENGDITPQHIYQGIMLLIQGFMGKL